jgi:hypothetical protein
MTPALHDRDDVAYKLVETWGSREEALIYVGSFSECETKARSKSGQFCNIAPDITGTNI